jgi:hypothetical protein
VVNIHYFFPLGDDTYAQMKAFSPQLPKQRKNMGLKFSLVFGETKILLIPLPEY